jgi:hypothetical protein
MSRRIDERVRTAGTGSESGLDTECAGSWQDGISCRMKIK